MALSTFWNRDGELHRLESFPKSLQHWEPGEPLEETHEMVLRKLESISGKEVIGTELRSLLNKYLVLEVQYKDGQQSILRMPKVDPNTEGQSSQDLSLFAREIALLQWLEKNSAALPIPRVLTMVHHSDDEPYTFSVIEKLPGDCVLNVFGAAPFDVKASIVRDMAKFMLQLNSVVVPQRIGTTVICDGVIDLIPMMPIIAAFKPDRVFDTLEEYMHFLVQAKRKAECVGLDDDCCARTNAVLDRVLDVLPSVLQRLPSPVYRRCVLSHDDLNETNVLVSNDGHITGIIDWEYHSTRPVVLVADYPLYLRYDGIHNPRFTPGADRWWIASPGDAAKLRKVYAEAVRAQNEDYWRALIDGELLRQVHGWLTSVVHLDPGCAAMGQWMDEAFGPHAP